MIRGCTSDCSRSKAPNIMLMAYGDAAQCRNACYNMSAVTPCGNSIIGRLLFISGSASRSAYSPYTRVLSMITELTVLLVILERPRCAIVPSDAAFMSQRCSLV